MSADRSHIIDHFRGNLRYPHMGVIRGLLGIKTGNRLFHIPELCNSLGNSVRIRVFMALFESTIPLCISRRFARWADSKAALQRI